MALLCILIWYQEDARQTSHPNLLCGGMMEPGLQAGRLLERPLLCGFKFQIALAAQVLVTANMTYCLAGLPVLSFSTAATALSKAESDILDKLRRPTRNNSLFLT
uniref:Uncharacterized protein n=1 Tax=mine drainage metagenome TaxID=410659 RepID=E6QQD1_9ZZZZ